MQSTATAALAATALWLSGAIATLPALAQDGDLGPLTAEEILAEDAADGFSPDEPYPAHEPADGEADGGTGDGFRSSYAEGVLDEAGVPYDNLPGTGLDPTPEELEQWAEADAAFQAELDAIWAELDESIDEMVQDGLDADYLRETWRESGSEQSYSDWLDEMAEDVGDYWNDDFETWDGGNDTRTAAEIRADQLQEAVRRLRAEDARRARWTASGSELTYEEWLEQTAGSNSWSDDFEEWGDDDWDDTDTEDSAWMEDLDSMTAGLMPGGGGVADPSALVDMIADDDDAILAVAWSGDNGFGIAMGERDRLEAVRDAIAVGTAGPMGTVDVAICEPGAAAVAAPGPGLILMAGPSEFSE